MLDGKTSALSEEAILKGATGIHSTVVWKKLYKFQRDGVVAAIEKLKHHGGCIIADSVSANKRYAWTSRQQAMPVKNVSSIPIQYNTTRKWRPTRGGPQKSNRDAISGRESDIAALIECMEPSLGFRDGETLRHKDAHVIFKISCPLEMLVTTSVKCLKNFKAPSHQLV